MSRPPEPVEPGEDHLYANEVIRWRSRCDTLVTCLCMGGTIYANERSSGGVDHQAELVDRPLADGTTIKVRPVIHRMTEDGRFRLAERANIARDELTLQTGIPWTSWAALAAAVMARKDLVGWLCAQSLLPTKPTKPKPRSSEHEGRTEASRAADAEAAADFMAGGHPEEPAAPVEHWSDR